MACAAGEEPAPKKRRAAARQVNVKVKQESDNKAAVKAESAGPDDEYEEDGSEDEEEDGDLDSDFERPKTKSQTAAKVRPPLSFTFYHPAAWERMGACLGSVRCLCCGAYWCALFRQRLLRRSRRAPRRKRRPRVKRCVLSPANFPDPRPAVHCTLYLTEGGGEDKGRSDKEEEEAGG
jgi:hypothetical protein